MSENLNKQEIPPRLAQDLNQRDQTALAEEALIKYQSIGLGPGISKNFRFLLMQDGRLFYAANSADPASDRMQVYNTALPDEPTRTLSSETVDDIQAKLTAVDFFDQPAYVAAQARDGSLAIVTARQNDQVHEVWYANVHNDLTDLLHSITPDEPVVRTPEEELAHWQSVLGDLEQQNAALYGDPPDNAGDETESPKSPDENSNP